MMEEKLLLKWSGPPLTPDEFERECERDLAEFLRKLRMAKQQQGSFLWFWHRGPKIDVDAEVDGWRKRFTEFAARREPGDEIHHFRSPDETWKDLAGREGFIILRDGRTVEQMIVTMN